MPLHAYDRLPPDVFNITAELKTAARRRGEDIIHFSMGIRWRDAAGYRGKASPLLRLTPMVTLPRGDARCVAPFHAGMKNAITSISIGIGSDCSPLVRRGAGAPDAGDAGSWRHRLVPNPSYPIHIYGAVIAGAGALQRRWWKGGFL